MIIKLRNFLKSKTRLELSYKFLLVSLVLLVFSTFLKIVDDGYGAQFNLYGQILGLFGAIGFLILSLFEFRALLLKQERAFIALRVINSIWLLNLLGTISQQVMSQQEEASSINTFNGFIEFGLGVFTGWAPSLSRNQYSSLLVAYPLIQYSLVLSLIIFASYLYLRFWKKQTLELTSIPELLKLADVKQIYLTDKLSSLAAIFLMISPFLKFISLPNYVNAKGSAFATSPIIALLIVVLAYFMLWSLSQQDKEKFNRYSVFVLLTFLRFNPFYILGTGSPGLGYFLYLAGLGILVYDWLTKHLIE